MKKLNPDLQTVRLTLIHQRNKLNVIVNLTTEGLTTDERYYFAFLNLNEVIIFLMNLKERKYLYVEKGTLGNV